MVHLSPDSAIKVKANPRKLFPDYIPQVRHEHVLADGGADCLSGIAVVLLSAPCVVKSWGTVA